MAAVLQLDCGGKSTNSELVRALNAADVGTVISSGEFDYTTAMGRLFSSEASLTRPVCIVQPYDGVQVAKTIGVARDFGYPITVRGGSHSSLCAADEALMIDLSAHCGHIILQGDYATVGGGATMGHVLATLGEQSRLIPVGVARTPGMGLALQGGIGHLTRSLGLTLDYIHAVEIVTSSGDVLQLSAQTSGDEADLWWAVRGCAPNFGIVTAMTVRTLAAPARVFAQRLVLKVDALPGYFKLAPTLPRSISASAVVGPPAGAPGEPVLFLYIVHAGDGANGLNQVREVARTLIMHSGAPPLLEHGDFYPYHDMPPMDVPALSGFPLATLPEMPSTNPRIFAVKKSPFVKNLDTGAAVGLIEAIRTAPTSLCRIDLQQCGGALSDISLKATTFWNRDFEWSCPIIGSSTGRDDDCEACANWVRKVAQLLAPYTVGTYSVEIIPGQLDTAKEVKLAFGGNLPRLQELKKKWDPENMFRRYYPI